MKKFIRDKAEAEAYAKELQVLVGTRDDMGCLITGVSFSKTLLAQEMYRVASEVQCPKDGLTIDVAP